MKNIETLALAVVLAVGASSFALAQQGEYGAQCSSELQWHPSKRAENGQRGQ